LLRRKRSPPWANSCHRLSNSGILNFGRFGVMTGYPVDGVGCRR
jgi:hypothetical protein